MQAETIENIWHHTKCIDLLKGQNIIEIDSEASVSEGCEVGEFAFPLLELLSNFRF